MFKLLCLCASLFLFVNGQSFGTKQDFNLAHFGAGGNQGFYGAAIGAHSNNLFLYPNNFVDPNNIHPPAVVEGEYGMGGPIHGRYNAGYLCNIICEPRIVRCRLSCTYGPNAPKCTACMGQFNKMCKICH